MCSRFYLRLTIADRPGVLADVCRLLADQHISLASVVQHEPTAGRAVPLVLVTHPAETARFRAALAAIDRLPAVAAAGVFYPMGD